MFREVLLHLQGTGHCSVREQLQERWGAADGPPGADFLLCALPNPGVGVGGSHFMSSAFFPERCGLLGL